MKARSTLMVVGLIDTTIPQLYIGSEGGRSYWPCYPIGARLAAMGQRAGLMIIFAILALSCQDSPSVAASPSPTVNRELVALRAFEAAYAGIAAKYDPQTTSVVNDMSTAQ